MENEPKVESAGFGPSVNGNPVDLVADGAVNVEAPKIEKVEPNHENEHQKKLWTEKNNWKTKAQDLERQLTEIREQSMREKEDYKGLYEKEREVRLQYEEEIKTTKDRQVDDLKRASVRKALKEMGAREDSIDGLVRLAEMKSLKYDDEHRMVLGVEHQAKEIKSLMPSAFGPQKVGVDHTPAQNIASTGDFSTEAWKALTPAQRRDPEIKKAFYAARGVTLRP